MQYLKNSEPSLPQWCPTLKTNLQAMADNLQKTLEKAMTECYSQSYEKTFTITPEACGYKSGLATEAIQKAINTAVGQGGGIVLLEKGDYVTGTIVLASNICLKIAEGARILGSTDLKDYPEHIAKRQTVMDTHMGMHQSLIFAEGCKNICICGGGTIDGQGFRENFPGEETIAGTPGRPFMMRIIDCENVHISGIRLENPACWTQNYLNCENVLLENLTVESQSNYNNDGIDIDGCRQVVIRNCNVSSGDDALCFKGASQRETANILVENCTLLSSCNAVKIGTDTQGDFRNILVRDCVIGGVSEEMRRIKHACADSGISVEAVDGGTVEHIWIDNVKIDRAMSPFFMRTDKRRRVKPGDIKPPISKMREIVFSNIKGEDNGPRGSYFWGIPESVIERVVLCNIELEHKPSVKETCHGKFEGEMYGEYPDAHMIDHLGDAPAYGLWTRNVRDLCMNNYVVHVKGTDKRPELLVE